MKTQVMDFLYFLLQSYQFEEMKNFHENIRREIRETIRITLEMMTFPDSPDAEALFMLRIACQVLALHFLNGQDCVNLI